MRYAGLCSILLLTLTACDDAVGVAYPAHDVGAEASPDMPSSDGSATDIADDADSSEDRAADLGLTQEMDYTCDRAGKSAHVVLYGQEEIAAILIPGKVNVPLYLDCSPTRIGPECADGHFTAHLNTLDDTALFAALEDAAPLLCALVPPEHVPGDE